MPLQVSNVPLGKCLTGIWVVLAIIIASVGFCPMVIWRCLRIVVFFVAAPRRLLPTCCLLSRRWGIMISVVISLVSVEKIFCILEFPTTAGWFIVEAKLLLGVRRFLPGWEDVSDVGNASIHFCRSPPDDVPGESVQDNRCISSLKIQMSINSSISSGPISYSELFFVVFFFQYFSVMFALVPLYSTRPTI